MTMVNREAWLVDYLLQYFLAGVLENATEYFAVKLKQIYRCALEWKRLKNLIWYRYFDVRIWFKDTVYPTTFGHWMLYPPELGILKTYWCLGFVQVTKQRDTTIWGSGPKYIPNLDQIVQVWEDVQQSNFERI